MRIPFNSFIYFKVSVYGVVVHVLNCNLGVSEFDISSR